MGGEIVITNERRQVGDIYYDCHFKFELLEYDEGDPESRSKPNWYDVVGSLVVQLHYTGRKYENEDRPYNISVYVNRENGNVIKLRMYLCYKVNEGKGRMISLVAERDSDQQGTVSVKSLTISRTRPDNVLKWEEIDQPNNDEIRMAKYAVENSRGICYGIGSSIIPSAFDRLESYFLDKYVFRVG